MENGRNAHYAQLHELQKQKNIVKFDNCVLYEVKLCQEVIRKEGEDMNIVLNRIDERLVHGQILASWAKKLQVREIVVIDEQIVTDQFAKTVWTMALPPEITLKIFDIKEGSQYLCEQYDGTRPNTILLMRTPEVAKQLWERGYCPSEINIGGMVAGPMRRRICRNFYASEKEISILKEFQENGTEIYVQVVYGENKILVDHFI